MSKKTDESPIMCIHRYSNKNGVVHSFISVRGRDICRTYENALSLLPVGIYPAYVFKSTDITKSKIKILKRGEIAPCIKAGTKVDDLKMSIVACMHTSIDGGIQTFNALKRLIDELPLGKMIMIEIQDHYIEFIAPHTL